MLLNRDVADCVSPSGILSIERYLGHASASCHTAITWAELHRPRETCFDVLEIDFDVVLVLALGFASKLPREEPRTMLILGAMPARFYAWFISIPSRGHSLRLASVRLATTTVRVTS